MKHYFSLVLVVLALLLIFFTEHADAGFSGDPAIDLTILPAFKLRAGGSDPGIDRGSNVWRCGTPFAGPLEFQCPNTATFSPAEATGGKQSWGVGANYVFFENFEVACGVELQPTFVWHWPYIIFDWQPYCVVVPTIIPAGTFGEAIIILEWGSDNTHTFGISGQPTSLMAYQPSALSDCVPNVLAAQFGLDTPCVFDTDSSYVVNNGYESDIRMTDNACNPSLLTLGKRVHGPADYDANCLTYFQTAQMSNLPEDYQDTTFLD